jgi:hypothetical protein
LPFWREKMRVSKICGAYPFYLGSLNTGPSDLFLSDIFGSSDWQSSLSFQSSVLQGACLFHLCTRVSRWDVDPEC